MTPNPLKARLAAARRMVISVKGRKTGRTFSYPVWHVVEGNRLYLLSEPARPPEIRLGVRLPNLCC